MRRLFLLAVFLFGCVAAQAQTTVFVPTCAGVNDGSKFTSIKSTVGTTKAAKIKLSYGKTCKFTSNLSLTSNLTLDASEGGLIEVANGVEFKTQGPVMLPLRQVFVNATGGGTVSFSGNRFVGDVFPQWWNAKGDGSTDDQPSLQAAADAVGTKNGGVLRIVGTLFSYLVTDSVQLSSNTTVQGDGYSSLIKCPDEGWDLSAVSPVTDHYGIFVIKNVSKVRITGVRIYGTKTAPIDAGCDGGFPRGCHTPKLIYLEGTGGASVMDGAMIDHNWLENSAWEGIWQGGDIPSTTHIQVTDNQFKDIDGPSAVTLNAEKTVVSNNIFQDCLLAIGVIGQHTTITGNQIKGATAQAIGVGEIGNGGYAAVVGNTVQVSPNAVNAWAGIQVIGSSTNGIINISSNVIQVTDSLGSAAGSAIRIQGGGKIDIIGNSMQGNGALYGVAAETTIDAQLSIRNNTSTLTSESATGNSSRGFIAVATAGALVLQSSGNKVYGMTRANSNYAYDYRTGGGTITANMVGDIKTGGYISLEGQQYGSASDDNVPLFLSSSITTQSAFTEQALIGMLQLTPGPGAIAISSGVITIAGISAGLPFRQTRVVMDTEGAGASDDLDTINGGQDGDILILSSVVSTRDITIKNNTGNIFCGTDFTLATVRDRITLMYDSGTSKWYKLAAVTN